MWGLRLSSWGGRRASDRGKPASAFIRRDRALDTAIRDGAIDLRFQPQIGTVSGRVHGVEALARWPSCHDATELFDRARAAGLAERLSRLIQRKALRAAAQWTGPLADLALAINLLPEELGRPGYDHWLLAEIAAAGLDPRRVTVEIVETDLVADEGAAATQLARLRREGIRIAIDDFGTGYSSLAYLTNLPLDAIKIDRGLITDIVGRERDRTVVRALIGLARDLGLGVVIEGVECEEQRSLLAQWGCDLYQGFLGAGALDEAELTAFVDRRGRQAA